MAVTIEDIKANGGDAVAYHWEGEPEGERRTITFEDLQRDVVRFANALKKLGVEKGTPVGIYMGMVPELPVAMLACARLGAPHTVVFGGFSADSLSGRLNDMECELLITQDEGLRNGAKVSLKRNADEALADSPTVKQAVVYRRTGGDIKMQDGRDLWWQDVVWIIDVPQAVDITTNTHAIDFLHRDLANVGQRGIRGLGALRLASIPETS